MIFTKTSLADAFVIDLEPVADERGFFARSFCRREFEAHGLNPELAQCNISHNRRRGTLRGMHWQAAPHQEAKLVRCIRGAIHDVIIDLRRDSPTFGRHTSVTLTASNRRMLYVPEGFAHGFLTLEDETEVFYQMSEFYAPASAYGVRYDDPAFAIAWPAGIAVVSERDRSYPDWAPELADPP
jgi:dTDP-4-dehydrorhamnose 3,5-epimerase